MVGTVCGPCTTVAVPGGARCAHGGGGGAGDICPLCVGGAGAQIYDDSTLARAAAEDGPVEAGTVHTREERAPVSRPRYGRA
eukprot:3516301-Pleurochrysis_carterae.AAC.1